MTDEHGVERWTGQGAHEEAGWKGRPGSSPGSSLPVVIVTAIDPALRASLVTGMLLDVPGAVELRYDVDPAASVLRRRVIDPHGVHEDELPELEHACVSCAMREDAVPSLDRLSRYPGVSAVLLSPPISADPSIVAGTLVPHQMRWRLAGAVSVLSAASALHDLLGTDTLAERDQQWAEEDARSVGEALAAQIEYAQLVVVDGAPSVPAASPRPAGAGSQDGPDGDAGAGLELVEHLRAPDQELTTSIHAVPTRALCSGRLDHRAGLLRRDPRAVDSYGGPTAHGTWTLDMHSRRPFHPRRFLENVEALGAGRLRSRGRFWVPDRPTTVCQWDGAGGQVSIGAMPDEPDAVLTTRLVVTGIEAADALRVREAFGRCLLTEEEWALGLSVWEGVDDELAAWLGQRYADHGRTG